MLCWFAYEALRMLKIGSIENGLSVGDELRGLAEMFGLSLRRDDAKHRAIAKWTFPIWLYVNVTGVVVYLMLYRM